ncbi:MAG: glycosyltransferase [Blastocatellia bacterium]|nr:glycosyltransferase [Blastocatellia bacterium]
MTSTTSIGSKNKKGRIVFAWNYVPWGGAQVYLLAVMKAARSDWDMLVILPAASNPEIIRYLEQLGVEYKAVDHHLDISPAPTLKRKLSRQLTRIKAEYRTYRELLKYDVRNTAFHIDIAPWQSVTFLSAMSLRGAKVFLTLHNFLPDGWHMRRLIWKTRFRFVSYLPGLNFFASNNDTKKRLRGWVNDKFWDRIRITFTAVNPPEIAEAATAPFDIPEVRARLGVAANDFVVLGVGQFIDRKGRWIFLDAAREVLKKEPGISFVWLTPQLPSAEDQARIGGYDLGNKFRLVHAEELGKDRIDVLKFFRISDAFALPSYVEGLPIALLEAMAMERPSIATNVYAIPEAVKDLDTGILIGPGDPVALAESILKLKADPELRERLARTGRDYVIKHFDERDAAASVIEAYEEALFDGS